MKHFLETVRFGFFIGKNRILLSCCRILAVGEKWKTKWAGTVKKFDSRA